MASDSTDTAFGFIMFILFLALSGTRRGHWLVFVDGWDHRRNVPVVTTTRG